MVTSISTHQHPPTQPTPTSKPGPERAAALDPGESRWLGLAIDLAERNVAEGGGPFGAVVVRDGRAVGRSGNRVTGNLDPTAHAEVMAIRAACQEVGDFRLDGTVLYSSCEPCPMCLAASLWARVERVVYAADRYDAAQAGFDDLEFYTLLDTPRDSWTTMPVQHLDHPGAGRPFEAWTDCSARIDY